MNIDIICIKKSTFQALLVKFPCGRYSCRGMSWQVQPQAAPQVAMGYCEVPV